MDSVTILEGSIGDVVADKSGDVFVADAGNGRIRRVDAQGTITTVAGLGAPPMAAHCCAEPAGLALDAFGNIYVSDLATRQIWFVNLGTVPTSAHGQTAGPGAAIPVAGTGVRGTAGDGIALNTPLSVPIGLAADRQGNLYIADYNDNTVRRLDGQGMLSTVVGIGTAGFNGDGLPARQTSLFNPTDVALDECGNLLVADYRNDRIRRVDIAPPCQPPATTARPWEVGALVWWTVGGGVLGLLAAIGGVVHRRQGLHARARQAAAGSSG